MLINRRTFRAEWGHCDPVGIVFYPHYLAWFDACTASLFERTGLPLRALYSKYHIVGMPLIEVQARFIIPCRFGDELSAESGVAEWGRSSLTVQHRLFKAGDLAVEGFEKRVWAVPHPDRPGEIASHPVPAEIIACLSDATGSTTCAD